jgi:simple sugar transport system substrate-binding protein
MDSGHALGAEAVKRFGLKAGDRAMVWGLLSQPTRGLRTKGVIDALKEAGLVVDYIEIDAATNKDPAAGTPTFTGYVSSHPDVKLVVTDHGGLTATLETYLKAAGKGPMISMASAFDMSPATLAADPRRLDRPGD